MTAPIVVRGRPTDAELAALTAVLLGRRVAEDEPVPAGPARRWGSARDRLRLPPAPGPGAWRAAIRH
ncbi:acyl-CoA carboxylase subunit epsilon [Micropruina sp.]|uniref:acyl-CoA carboxylase subunit epsilon n=1 Tax=Micropruina sp. TaxID=2737536 RepID=UPI0039E71C29